MRIGPRDSFVKGADSRERLAALRLRESRLEDLYRRVVKALATVAFEREEIEESLKGRNAEPV